MIWKIILRSSGIVSSVRDNSRSLDRWKAPIDKTVRHGLANEHLALLQIVQVVDQVHHGLAKNHVTLIRVVQLVNQADLDLPFENVYIPSLVEPYP